MLRHVEGIIKFRGGPVTFAEYMRAALSSPVGGYYGDKGAESIVGSKGDFVTSPEISQLFGEMVGLWALTVWEQLQQPKSLRLVELGPGKGTLMADLLRSTSSPSPIFQSFQSALHNGEDAGVHLVEISPSFRKIQADVLSKFEKESQKGSSLVKWYNTLADVPKDDIPTIYIAHEFFDALPVHMFVKKSDVWSEILVDLKERKAVSLDPADSNSRTEPELEMILAPGGTPAMKFLLSPKLETLDDTFRESVKEIEISASAMEHALDIGERLVSSKAGGAALCIDYGYEKLPGRFTCRAIHNHKVLDDLLELTGQADLTADVDFSALRWAIEKRFEREDKVPKVHGPISQTKFLQSLGIEYRVQDLLQNTKMTPKQAEDLVIGYKRLVSNEKSIDINPSDDGETESKDSQISGMGEIYKAMAITSFPKDSSPPVGF